MASKGSTKGTGTGNQQEHAAGNQAVGKVFILYGTAKAVAPDGTVRALAPNSLIFAHDQIITESDGSVSIQFDGPPVTQLDLGRMSKVTIDEDVYAGAAPGATAESAAEAEQIQKALLEGDQPLDLEATAAGGDGGAGGGLTSPFSLSLTGGEVTPTSGAGTGGTSGTGDFSGMMVQAAILDTTPPAVAITTIEGGDDVINAAEAAGGITVSGTTEVGATLTVNGVAVVVDGLGNWTTSVTPAGQGPLTVTAVATDAAGNSATATQVLTVDTIPPAVAITAIEGGNNLINAAEAAGGIIVSGTAEIGSTLTVNGAAVVVDASGNWTTSVTPAGQGPLTVTAVATDAAGNSSTATQALTVDTIPPAVAITAIEGGNNLINAAEAAGGIIVSGTAEIGSTLTVNGAAVVVDASGNWTTSVATAGQGPLTVTAVATDAAGNSSTATQALTVDTNAPAVAITAIEGGNNLINAAEAAGGIIVSGTAEIGSTLTVNGAAVVVDASGNWTTSVTPAGQGPLTVTAVATDAAGNSSTATQALAVDTNAPAVAITAIEGGDNVINAAEAAGGIIVSGTAEIGSTLTVNGAAVTVDASGNWTTSVTPAGEGPLTVTAVATDAAGNSSTATQALTVDTIPPAVAITAIEGGDNVINAAEAAGGIIVSGTAEIGSTLTVNGAAVTVDASGNWTTSVTPAGEGPLTVTAVATDAAGNSSTATQALTVDTIPPAVAITAIEGGDNVINAAEAAGGIIVSGTAEIGSTLTVNGAAVTVDASGNWTTSVTPAGEGPLTVTAVATDAAGNSSTATQALTVDTIPPAVAITTIEGGDNLINAAEAAGGIIVSGTAEIGSTLTVNGAAVVVDASGNWTTSVTPAGEGPLTVTAVATDAAGNSSTATQALAVDTIPPAVAITTIEGGDNLINAAEAAGGIIVSGTAEIGSTLTVNGATVVVDASGNWTTSVTPAGQGPLTVTAVATDAAGNSATATQVLTVDTASTAGTLSLTNFTDSGTEGDFISNDNTFNLRLTGNESGSTVVYQVSGNGGESWTDAAAAQSNLEDGSYQFRAQVTDVAGNTATSNTISVTVDTAAVPGTLALSNFEDSGSSTTDFITNDKAFDLNLTGNESGSTVVYQVSGNGGESWTDTTAAQSDLEDGSYQFRAQVTDVAGNKATSNAISVTVDTAAVPGTLALSNFEDSGSSTTDFITNDKAFDLNLTGNESGSTVVYQVSGNGGESWTDTTAAQSDLEDGSYQFRAQVTDVAGNKATSNAISVTVDTAAVPGTLALSNFEDSGSSTTDFITNDKAFDLNLTGNESGSTVVYQVSGNGGESWTDTTAAQSDLEDGSYQFRAQVTDVAGNKATSNAISVTVDNTPPSASITLAHIDEDYIDHAAKDHEDVAVTGTVGGDVQNGDTVRLTVNGVDYTGAVANGSFSINVPGSALAADTDQTISASVTTTDAAGNSATATDTMVYSDNWFITSGHDQGDQFGQAKALTEGDNATFHVQFKGGGGGCDDEGNLGRIGPGGSVTVTLAIGGTAGATDFQIDSVVPSHDFQVDNWSLNANANLLTVTLKNISSTKEANLEGNPFDVVVHTVADQISEPGGETLTFDISTVTVGGVWEDHDQASYVINDNLPPTVDHALTAGALEDANHFHIDLLHGAKDADGDNLYVDDVTYSVDGGSASGTAPNGVSLTGEDLKVSPADDAFQHLAQGVKQTITVGYDVVDEHGASVQQTATVTITGVNDKATITGDHDGMVTKVGGTDSGTLKVIDPDDGESLFKVPTDLEGDHGTFTFQADGQWSYTLDEVKISKGADHDHDTLHVDSLDGSADINIDILIQPPHDPC